MGFIAQTHACMSVLHTCVACSMVVLVMCFARVLAAQAHAQHEGVVEGAILRRSRPTVSVGADSAEKGDAAASRAAGGASAGACGRAIRRSHTLQKAFERELERREEKGCSEFV
jgi:hypothetical protein